jgi:hypothetical protein
MAPADKQTEIIDRLRSEKGVVNTEALAAAIPRLSGTARTKARDALAERLARLKPEKVGDYLGDEDAEIRRAAALATAMKECRTLIPKLIALLRDPEPAVVRAAHVALKELSGQDFGPHPDDWSEWWRKNGQP